MLIFVEQDRRKIENKTKRKDVIDIMNFMETLKFKPGDAVTYDRDAFLNSCEEDVKQRLEEATEKLENAKIEANEKLVSAEIEVNQKLKSAEIEANKRLENAELEEEKIKQSRKELEQEKISLAKALKAEGYPTNKITKITKLSKNIIMML